MPKFPFMCFFFLVSWQLLLYYFPQYIANLVSGHGNSRSKSWPKLRAKLVQNLIENNRRSRPSILPKMKGMILSLWPYLALDPRSWKIDRFGIITANVYGRLKNNRSAIDRHIAYGAYVMPLHTGRGEWVVGGGERAMNGFDRKP